MSLQNQLFLCAQLELVLNLLYLQHQGSVIDCCPLLLSQAACASCRALVRLLGVSLWQIHCSIFLFNYLLLQLLE